MPKFKISYRQAINSKITSFFLLCIIFYITAAASFSGFIGKWGLNDDDWRTNIQLIFDGTAPKPWVYRQLAPIISELVYDVTPSVIKKHVVELSYKHLYKKQHPYDLQNKSTVSAEVESKSRYKYVVVYYITFASFFFSLFTLRLILLDAGVGKLASVLAPISFLLALPYLQTIGGYFYDGIELLFLGLAFITAKRGKILLLFFVLILATLNKETFIFFIPALYPFVRNNFKKNSAVLIVLIAILTAGIINIIMKFAFLEAPGNVGQFQLSQNIAYFYPSTYFHIETTYGVLSPQGMFIGTLATIIVIVSRGWSRCSDIIRRHIYIAASVNFPLLLTFSATGELRNLSFLFIGFVILTAYTIENTVTPNIRN
jgi:hypothetical protein